MYIHVHVYVIVISHTQHAYNVRIRGVVQVENLVCGFLYPFMHVIVAGYQSLLVHVSMIMHIITAS